MKRTAEAARTPLARRRGQGGMTIVELLIVISVGTIVLIPLFGLVNQTLLRRQPTVESANDSKQLRLFRSAIAEDWAAAKVIKIGATSVDTECNHGSMTSYLSAVDGPLIAIQAGITTLGNTDKRIIYNTRATPETDDDPAAIELLRRECYHNPNPPTSPVWGHGSSVNAAGGSQKVVLRGIREVRIPGTCNPPATHPLPPPAAPYAPCDMNITVVGLDGQTTTIRLYQHTGRTS